MLFNAIYDYSAWLIGLLFLAPGLAFAAASLLVARRITSTGTRTSHSELVSFTVTNIAVLYGVLLAFLAVAAWENFTRASDSASREAGLVGNLYRDAQGMAPSLAADLRGHVLDYLHDIIDVEWPMQSSGTVPPETERALVRLHRHVAALTPADSGDTVLMGDMLRTINDLDTARAARLEALGGHIPALVWWLIVAMGLLTVGLTAFLDGESIALQAGMLGALVLAIVLVLLMIVELDNPFRGTISVSVKPYQHVMAQIQEPEPAGDND